VNLEVHFIRARSLILSCFSGSPDPPFLYITLFYILRGEVEEEKRIVGERAGRRVGEISQSSLTGRIVFHILFML